MECKECGNEYGETVTIVSEIYQRLDLTTGDLNRGDIESTLRICCDNCMMELPDEDAKALGIDESLIPYRSDYVEPAKPMLVLLRFEEAGSYDDKTVSVDAIAVSEHRKALENAILEHAIVEGDDGSYRFHSGCSYRIEAVMRLAEDGSAT
jgi:hypothetical protein